MRYSSFPGSVTFMNFEPTKETNQIWLKPFTQSKGMVGTVAKISAIQPQVPQLDPGFAEM